MQRSLVLPFAVLACLAVPAVAVAADRDGDQLPDRWERRHGLSTKKWSAAGDPDRDRLSNRREYRLRLDPQRADSDGDGWADLAELAQATDPRRKKSHPDKGTTPLPVPELPVPLPTPEPSPSPTPTPTPTPSPTPTPTPSPTPTPTPPPAPGGGGYATCTQTASSASAVTSAVSSASPGAVICLTDGTYTAMTFSSNKSGEVTVRAQNPGRVNVGSIKVSGSNIRFAGLRFVGSTLQLQPPAHHVTVERSYFSGGGFGVDMASSDANISDVTIRANRFVGPFGEDAIRANRYHDGDGDGRGLLVEGNEFTNVIQLGGSTAPHADLLQSVWGGDHIVFRRNYAHDNRAENFFVKDQRSTVTGVVLEDNLLIRNDVPSSGAGQPAIVNLYGPTTGLVLNRNTVWDTSTIAWQGSSWGSIAWTSNVIKRVWGSGSGGSWTLSDNTYCEWTGTLPAVGSGSAKNCTPAFNDPASDDYRLSGSSRGVTWRPADQVYGP